MKLITTPISQLQPFKDTHPSWKSCLRHLSHVSVGYLTHLHNVTQIWGHPEVKAWSSVVNILRQCWHHPATAGCYLIHNLWSGMSYVCSWYAWGKCIWVYIAPWLDSKRLHMTFCGCVVRLFVCCKIFSTSLNEFLWIVMEEFVTTRTDKERHFHFIAER